MLSVELQALSNLYNFHIPSYFIFFYQHQHIRSVKLKQKEVKLLQSSTASFMIIRIQEKETTQKCYHKCNKMKKMSIVSRSRYKEIKNTTTNQHLFWNELNSSN